MYVGQEGIKQFFLRGKKPPEFLHGLMQLSGIVDVDPGGKTAKGRWYGFGPHAIPSRGSSQGTMGRSGYMKTNM